MKEWQKLILEEYRGEDSPEQFLSDLRRWVSDTLSPQNSHPVDTVIWVPVDDVEPNDYNPNYVNAPEMGLLRLSIEMDGYTQPIVTYRDKDRGKYVIVDGFHRYFIGKQDGGIRSSTGGMVPVVVIDKPLNDRMASTIRHNRARGEHAVQGMSQMVFKLLRNGWSDAQICNHLGMEPDEVLKLKHITGFSKLFENHSYNKAWETDNQIRIRLKHQSNDKEKTT